MKRLRGIFPKTRGGERGQRVSGNGYWIIGVKTLECLRTGWCSLWWWVVDLHLVSAQDIVVIWVKGKYTLVLQNAFYIRHLTACWSCCISRRPPRSSTRHRRFTFFARPSTSNGPSVDRLASSRKQRWYMHPCYPHSPPKSLIILTPNSSLALPSPKQPGEPRLHPPRRPQHDHPAPHLRPRCRPQHRRRLHHCHQRRWSALLSQSARRLLRPR